MGRTGKKGTGAERAVVSAREGQLGALKDILFGPSNISPSSLGLGNNAGPIRYSPLSSVDMNALQAAGYQRANQLLSQNPELKDTTTVMLPNGNVEARPNPDISIEEARRRVASDVMTGRKSNLYEQGLATGSVLTKEDQAIAQRALRNEVGSLFVSKDTFDVIPQVSQELLRRAAGAGASVPGEVKLKAKSFQNTQLNQNNRPGQPGQPGQGNRPFGKFIRTTADKEWLNRKFDPNDSSSSSSRGAINEAIKSSTNKDALIGKLSSDNRTRLSRPEAIEFVSLLDVAS